MSGAITERLHKESESRRLLAAARIIKVIAGKRRAPVCQQPYQTSRCDSRMDIFLRQVRYSQAIAGALPCKRDVVDGQLAFDANAERPSVLFELPGIEAP